MSNRLHGVSASITYNESSQQSLISHQFVDIHSLPTSNGQCSVSVSVPTLDNTIFTADFDLTVTCGISFDAVLGKDWIGTCRAVAAEGHVVFPLSSPEGARRSTANNHPSSTFLSSESQSSRTRSLTTSQGVGTIPSTSFHSHTLPSFDRPQNNTNAQLNHVHTNISEYHSVTQPHSSETVESSPDMSPIPDHGRELLSAILLRKFRTGVSTSVFCDDVDAMRHSLALHGMPATCDMSVRECRVTLLYHLMRGHCCEYERDVESSPRPDRTGCRCVSAGFTSREDLSAAAFEIVLDANAKCLSTDRLVLIATSTGVSSESFHVPRNTRRQARSAIEKQKLATNTEQYVHPSVEKMFDNFENLPKASLVDLASLHCLKLDSRSTREQLREGIMTHLASGNCFRRNIGQEQTPGCSFILDDYKTAQKSGVNNIDNDDIQIHILEILAPKLKRGPMCRLLTNRGIEFSREESLSKLRRVLKKYIVGVKKGKRAHNRREHEAAEHAEFLEKKADIRRNWPQLVPKTLKDKIVRLFREQTSKEVLSTFTCASCAEECLSHDKQEVTSDDINMELLRRPDVRTSDDIIVDPSWLDSECLPPNLPSTSGPLRDALLDYAGVVEETSDKVTLFLCKGCLASLNANKTPPLSLANHTYLGDVPEELKDLTVVEEAMIARCRAKCWVVQLKEDNQDLALPHSQRGMKGHIIVYPQRPSDIANVLPPSMDEISAPICVIFVGSSPPSDEWIREKAKPLTVRREKVRAALIWLKEHNGYYKDITINHTELNSMSDSQILPVHVEKIVPDRVAESLTARYDATDSLGNAASPISSGNPHETPIPFQNVVVTDVEGHAPSNELRAAAIRHVKKKGGGYIEIPHDPKPVNEFFNPDMFPMIYPTLFPYGIGGFENCIRTSKLSMKRHVKHLFSLGDRRFQEHYSFLFTAFNILQRRAVLLHSSLKVKKTNFDVIAADFATVSPEAIHIVSERVAQGDFATAHNDEERKVLNLMKQVKVVTSHVPGSSASRVAMRNEIRGLMIDQGLPSFYITINPADVFNPLVKFLAGADIDVDNLLPEQVPDYWEQAILVAKNPAVAAKFFNLYMKAFISAILGYEPKKKHNLEGGILGQVKAYYGCVEAQGREDPNPNLTVPSSRHHPCSVRGVSLGIDGDDVEAARQKDLHHLVQQCQSHSHSGTCYKYWKGPPEPKECRFDLDEKHHRAESMFDMNTGEICLRCLDGMVNNFNATILEAVRCNMDIKFIGSGASAKAILYYITDYITKSQLKTHVAYAALDLAVSKLGEYNPEDDDFTARAKKLLQKCAYSMISHQELSAQQVSSYLMDFEDHFTSHKYENLYWTSFESLINKEDPSPNCYAQRTENKDVSEPENDDDDDDEVPANDLQDNEEENEENSAQELDEGDISVIIKSSGEMVAKAAQVADYQLRSNELDRLCVWDFAAQIEKVKKNSRKYTEEDDDSEFNDDENHVNEEDGDMNEHGDHSSELNDIEHLLNIRANKRPRGDFLPLHVEATSHELKVRNPKHRRVPVPIGPSIPRRDRDELRERYSRLMLIFFKPWRHAKDLRESNEKWSDAFERFMNDCPPRFKAAMNHMQILHECRDSRDDHFADRRSRNRARRNGISQEHMSRTNLNDDFSGEADEDIILEHLQAIDSSKSQRKANSQNDVLRCLSHAEACGMYSIRDCNVQEVSGNETNDGGLHAQDIGHDSVHLEDIWRKAYEDRRDQWKKKSATSSTRTGQSSAVNEGSSSSDILPNRSLIRDGSAFRNPVNSQMETRVPAVRQQLDATDPERNVNISQMIDEYTLNAEQARAFKIVAEHSLTVGHEALRMYLGGPGGTGKSRVINALKSFFERRNQSRRFRLASYTGVAAKNISGMTLHSALSLNQRAKGGSKGSTRRDLIAMWEGVDYLFIDEVSMIGCKFLLRISEALTEAKQNTSTFGGINIIFAGDFAQLPPVGETRLFAHVNATKAGCKGGQCDVFGKLLWLSVKVVVILTEVMRQSGPENEAFVSLLGRLRRGECTDADYNLLNSRIAKNVKPNWSDPEWSSLPVIVTDNTIKDALNLKAVRAFAQRTRREMHWYYATDVRGGKEIENEELKTHLYDMHSGQTNQRLGRIPMVLGMPVMITTNFDVEAGVVNGCTGTLKQIRYRTDSEGNRHAISCIVETLNTTGSALPHLPSNYSVALEDTTEMSFKHPYSQKKCSFKRTQVPIMPAFAMTAHKAQGQTLSRAIVDLANCRGTESPYVMISRVTSLDGLLILRPFEKKKIQCRQSEETRREMARLKILRLKTVMQVGSSEESAQAQEKLKKTNARCCIGEELEDDVDQQMTSHADPNKRLNLLQAHYLRLTNNSHRPSVATNSSSMTINSDSDNADSQINRKPRPRISKQSIPTEDDGTAMEIDFNSTEPPSNTHGTKRRFIAGSDTRKRQRT